MSETTEKFEGWSILELMGHRRLGGYVTEVSIAGAGFLRIDIPADDPALAVTQFYPPASVYALTPVTEAMARAVAKRNLPQPVSRWELPEATAAPSAAAPDYADDDPLSDDELDEADDDAEAQELFR